MIGGEHHYIYHCKFFTLCHWLPPMMANGKLRVMLKRLSETPFGVQDLATS